MLFKDPAKLRKHIEDALSDLNREMVIQSQAKLGEINPRDTGRMRSSWFAQVGSASDAVAPEGTDRPNDDAKLLPLQFKEDVHLTNNLPYAQPVALGINLPPSWGGENRVWRASQSWYKDFRDATMPKIRKTSEIIIKNRYEL